MGCLFSPRGRKSVGVPAMITARSGSSAAFGRRCIAPPIALRQPPAPERSREIHGNPDSILIAGLHPGTVQHRYLLLVRGKQAMASLMRNFVERRVPHSVALYIGVSWGCVQFI